MVACAGSGGVPGSKEKLAAAHAYADSIRSSAVMIVQGGTVIDEWGDVDKKISYSARESFISSLYGIYSAEGVIDVNQTLEQIAIDDSADRLTKAETETGARCGFAARAFRRLSRRRFRNRVDEEKPSSARQPPAGRLAASTATTRISTSSALSSKRKPA